MTVAWQPPPGHGIVGCAGQRGPAIEGYLLELDDGCGGEFRVNQRFFERGRNVLLPRKGEREREKIESKLWMDFEVRSTNIYIYIYINSKLDRTNWAKSKVGGKARVEQPN